MIIKELRIKNFRSYYGDNNRFVFSDGLTLIIGDNGDGKTTFFEALQWLFNTTVDKGSMDHVSEMRKSKLEIGESDEVTVSMLFEHDGEKSVEKSFSFERTGEDTFKVGSLMYRGFETNNSERVSVNGKALIDRCYDAFIQRFSMFKGESELNVFDSPTALKDLVDKFSDIRQFDKLEEFSASFAQKANTAYLKQIKSDEKVSKEASSLELRIKHKADEISQTKTDIKEKTHSLELFTTKLSQLEQSQETSERYKDISNRFKTKQEKATRLRAQIGMVDYNHSLLDKLWILGAFPPILKEFQQKCSALSKEKRQLERDFDKQQAAAKAKLDTIKELQGVLINGATELPWYLPNQETMEEMLHDHICKVCGRPAPEGSEAYDFMLHKLEDYKRHAEAKIKKEAAEKEIEKQKDIYWNKFLAHRAALIDYGYIENDYPTLKGKTTSQIRSENELYLAEIIFSGVLENLTPSQLAGVICAITTEEIRMEIPYIPFSEPVRKTLNQIRNIKRKLEKVQSKYDIEAPIYINPYFSSLIELWVEGAEWETVSEQIDIGEGDIVRAFKRVVDVLRQLTTIDNIPESLVFTAREAIEKILRAPVDVD